MKVAHSVLITPHKAGLYETARDLAQAENEVGLDARLVDPHTVQKGEDRGVPLAGLEFITHCDVIVNHSGLSKYMSDQNKPVVHMLHGRPYSSFLLEQRGKIAIYSYWRRIAKDQKFKAFVTFWPEFIPYFENMFEREIHLVTAPVDLTRWTPDGPRGYKFGGLKGDINIVVTDIWREDKDPYHVINGFMQYAKGNPLDVKLHVYAAPDKAPGWDALRGVLDARGWLGEVKGFVTGLENVYRAADVLITPQSMATRSVREALACGCQVVSGNPMYTFYAADPEKPKLFARMIALALNEKLDDPAAARSKNRERAEIHFDPRNTAEEFIKILEGVIHGERRRIPSPH